MDVVTLLSGILDQSPTAICVADPRLPDCPTIYANPAFEALSGYSREDVVGRNCRFLQGPETSASELAGIAMAVRQRIAWDAVLLNYRKDGTPFHNYLLLEPIRFASGPQYILGSQFDFSPETRRTQFAEHFERLRDQIMDDRLVAADMAEDIRASFSKRAQAVVDRLRRYGWDLSQDDLAGAVREPRASPGTAHPTG